MSFINLSQFQVVFAQVALSVICMRFFLPTLHKRTNHKQMCIFLHHKSRASLRLAYTIHNWSRLVSVLAGETLYTNQCFAFFLKGRVKLSLV